jgi:hypothetical protein
MRIINGAISVILVGTFLYSVFNGYSPTPTDMLGLAILNGLLYLDNRKNNESDN